MTYFWLWFAVWGTLSVLAAYIFASIGYSLAKKVAAVETDLHTFSNQIDKLQQQFAMKPDIHIPESSLESDPAELLVRVERMRASRVRRKRQRANRLMADLKQKRREQF
mgnify:CR=1 FL=1